MPEMPTTRFMMYGARAAIAGGMFHIQEQVDALETAVNENTGLAFDLAKTIIESTCRAILSERRVDFEPGDDLPGLFKAARNTLPFLPATASSSSDVRKSLAQTLGGLSAACSRYLRTSQRMRFCFTRIGGAKACFGIRAGYSRCRSRRYYCGVLVPHSHPRSGSGPSRTSLYDTNVDFNDYVDDAHERVSVFDEDFLPSRILFELAPEPYRLYLAEFKQESLANAEGDGATTPDILDNHPGMLTIDAQPVRDVV